MIPPFVKSKLYTVAFALLLVRPFSSALRPIPSYAGPYKVIVKQLVNLTGEEAGTRQVWVHAYVNSYRPGHPQYLRGRVVNTVPLTDEYQLISYTHIRSNNEWKKNSFVMKFPNFCTDALKYAINEMTLLFGEADVKKCPIPIGDRIIKNRTINLNYPDFPIFPYGRWLVTNIIRDKTGKSIGGASMDVESIPKV